MAFVSPFCLSGVKAKREEIRADAVSTLVAPPASSANAVPLSKSSGGSLETSSARRAK